MVTTFRRDRVTRGGTVLVLAHQDSSLRDLIEAAATGAGLEVLDAPSGRRSSAESTWAVLQTAEIVVIVIDDAHAADGMFWAGAATVLGKKQLVLAEGAHAETGALGTVVVDPDSSPQHVARELVRLRDAPSFERTVVSVPADHGAAEEVDVEVVEVRADAAVVRAVDGRHAVLLPEDVSWTRKVRDLRRVIRQGQPLHGAFVGRYDDSLRFSVRAVEEDPWPRLERLMEAGAASEGTVFSWQPRIGLFVTLDDIDVNGLVPRSTLPDEAGFEPGDRVGVVVRHVDRDAKEVSLALVSLSPPASAQPPEPLDHLAGDRVVGTVTHVSADRGYVLVELHDGFTAILPAAGLSLTGREALAAGKIRVGSRLPVVVTKVDRRRRRVELADDLEGHPTTADPVPETVSDDIASLHYELLLGWARLEPFVLMAERVSRQVGPSTRSPVFTPSQLQAIDAWAEEHRELIRSIRTARNNLVHAAGFPDPEVLLQHIAVAKQLLEKLHAQGLKDVVRVTPTAERREHDQALSEGFGKRVRACRRVRGLSQEGLAELAGLHRTYIGHIERGEVNISIYNIIRIASALEVDPAELVSGLRPAAARPPGRPGRATGGH
jgi:DNA-binding XRE family transcriptional regulator